MVASSANLKAVLLFYTLQVFFFFFPAFVKPGELSDLSVLHSCINEVSAQMSHSFLQLKLQQN